MDFVPIEGYITDTLNVAIGNSVLNSQRGCALTILGQSYDRIITANASLESEGDFWIYARNCSNDTAISTLGIIRYNPSSAELPPTPPGNRVNFGCLDPRVGNLVPVVAVEIGSSVNGLSPSEYLNVSLSYYSDVNEKSPYSKWIYKAKPCKYSRVLSSLKHLFPKIHLRLYCISCAPYLSIHEKFPLFILVNGSYSHPCY
jgi:hypothetical protein